MKIDGLIYFLIIAEIILCLYSGFTTTSNNLFCSVKGSCDLVQSSPFSHVLGIKLSFIATFAFLIMLFAFMERDKKLIYRAFFLMSLIGATLAVIYIGIQIFILRALCESCLIIDTTAIILYMAVIFKEARENNIQTTRIKFK